MFNPFKNLFNRMLNFVSLGLHKDGIPSSKMKVERLPSYLRKKYSYTRQRDLLPPEVQERRIIAAQEKRERKNDKRRVVFFQQQQLGLFKQAS